MTLAIRPAAAGDRAAIWAILEPVIRAGETYTLARDMGEVDALVLALAFAAMRQHPRSIGRVALASVEGMSQTVKLPAHVDAAFARIDAAEGRPPFHRRRCWRGARSVPPPGANSFPSSGRTQ